MDEQPHDKRHRSKWYADPPAPAWATERTDEQPIVDVRRLRAAPLLTRGQAHRANNSEWRYA